MPKDGVASAFKFGQNYGLLRGVLISCNIPFHQATPAKWKGTLGLKKKDNESQSQFKARSREMAQRLYPKTNGRITNATAEALLLVHYYEQHVKK